MTWAKGRKDEVDGECSFWEDVGWGHRVRTTDAFLPSPVLGLGLGWDFQPCEALFCQALLNFQHSIGYLLASVLFCSD